MKKMSVNDAAEYFGISKEAIHNRIRRGSLQSVVEEGVKMVMIDDKPVKSAVKKVAPRRTDPNNDRYYKLLEEQNVKLQSRVDVLEKETRSLRDQKEQMLIEEREKIEKIYKEKDEQLKTILSSIASKFMLNAPVDVESEVLEDIVEVESEPVLIEESESEVISLKKYLKEQEFSQKKKEKINKRFQRRIASNDERIILIGSKYYLDILKYDYSDLVR